MAALDERAFGSFYESYFRSLWTFVYRVTGHPADTDDIVQEAFLRVLRSQTPIGDDDQRRRYLFRVASNLAVDRWRDHRRTGLIGLADTELVDSARGIDLDIARLFATLSSRDRALLWLAYVEEESHDEIAASLGVGRLSVKVLLFRARRRLRDLLRSKNWTGE